MKKIKDGFILPSAAFTVSRNTIKFYDSIEKKPEVGDLAYCKIEYTGQHESLENCEGRIHRIQDGTHAIMVYGNRYAPDYYEGFVPEAISSHEDLLARSGVIGKMKNKSSLVADPTKVKVLGYVCNKDGKVLNTRDYNKIIPKKCEKKGKQRAKMILCVGTSMNSGKSAAAAACCWGLSTMGHTVRGSKITGTASLKDILSMEDNGARPVSDFTYLGFPSTYMLSEEELLFIFNSIDMKYGNKKNNYWVVEIADGIMQRETSMLLRSEVVRERIHKLVFCAYDAMGAIGGIRMLKDEYGLVPDAVSGVCSSSPLGIREVSKYTDIPIFNSRNRNLDLISKLIF